MACAMREFFRRWWPWLKVVLFVAILFGVGWQFVRILQNEELQKTDLWSNVKLRTKILNEALPNLLIKQIGLETILARVPENYLKAIFGSYLASRFVYKFGPNPSQFAFYSL